MQDEEIEKKEPQEINHTHDVGSNLGCFFTYPGDMSFGIYVS